MHVGRLLQLLRYVLHSSRPAMAAKTQPAA